MKIEYRVRKVTRYIVTRHFEDGQTGGLSNKGEYDNPDIAHDVAYALCREEHRVLGYPIGDERVQYPKREVVPVGVKECAGDYEAQSAS